MVQLPLRRHRAAPLPPQRESLRVEELCRHAVPPRPRIRHVLLPAGARAGAARRARSKRVSRFERAVENHEASVRFKHLDSPGEGQFGKGLILAERALPKRAMELNSEVAHVGICTSCSTSSETATT